MAKKIIKVEDTKKESKSSIDLGKITKTIMENGDAIGKIAEGALELLNSQKESETVSSKKASTKKTSSKKSTKRTETKKDSLGTVIDIAETILKNK